MAKLPPNGWTNQFNLELEARNGEVKSPVAPKVAKLNLKAELRMVWETGQFNGAGMKACEATDDMVAWAARLIGEEPNHRGKRK